MVLIKICSVPRIWLKYLSRTIKICLVLTDISTRFLVEGQELLRLEHLHRSPQCVSALYYYVSGRFSLRFFCPKAINRCFYGDQVRLTPGTSIASRHFASCNSFWTKLAPRFLSTDPARFSQPSSAASERRGNQFKGFNDVYLRNRTKI